jgi:hypothetical protein
MASGKLIRSKKIILCSDPDYDPDAEGTMDFHLTYEGPLLGSSSANSRARHKHEIRRKFRQQLQRYWQIHPYLQTAKFGVCEDIKEYSGRHVAARRVGNIV